MLDNKINNYKNIRAIKLQLRLWLGLKITAISYSLLEVLKIIKLKNGTFFRKKKLKQ
jgi:hypothetical protein